MYTPMMDNVPSDQRHHEEFKTQRSEAAPNRSDGLGEMDSETQEAFEIGPDITRENLTTKNLDLSTLNRGDILTLGTSVKLEVTGDCEPCRNLDSKRPGLSREIKGKRGILCRVIGPGFVKVNDEIACEAKQL